MPRTLFPEEDKKDLVRSMPEGSERKTFILDDYANVEALLQAAIDDVDSRGTNGLGTVKIPEEHVPYDQSAVTFKSSVKLEIEGQDPSVIRAMAYGANGGDTSVDAEPNLAAAINHASNVSSESDEEKPEIVVKEDLGLQTNVTVPSGVTLKTRDCRIYGKAAVQLITIQEGAGADFTVDATDNGTDFTGWNLVLVESSGSVDIDESNAIEPFDVTVYGASGQGHGLRIAPGGNAFKNQEANFYIEGTNRGLNPLTGSGDGPIKNNKFKGTIKDCSNHIHNNPSGTHEKNEYDVTLVGGSNSDNGLYDNAPTDNNLYKFTFENKSSFSSSPVDIASGSAQNHVFFGTELTSSDISASFNSNSHFLIDWEGDGLALSNVQNSDTQKIKPTSGSLELVVNGTTGLTVGPNSASVNGPVESDSTYTNQVDIATDSVHSFSASEFNGKLIVREANSTIAEFYYDTFDGTVTKISENEAGIFETNNGSLSGTTGSNSVVTIGVDSNNVYIENRTASDPNTITYTKLNANV